ncbi:TIGR03899 family protein [Photobacterium sanguinicancri]|uniref:TIGR03899 family protein n=1 Tax=Photobacterium sanguinicancri TaxID=875932 RepID=UPI0024812F9A|nr:TIGR03899 family protein [Photobacterium sanguinicancri]
MSTPSDKSSQALTVKSTQPPKDSASSPRRSSKQYTEAIGKLFAINHLITESEERSLELRTQQREQKERETQQVNLEKILKIAYDVSTDDSANMPDPDWLAHFMFIAKNIYSANMQALWGRVLKKEVIAPGSFSIKALNTLKNMTKKDAHAFQHACSLSCSFGTDQGRKLLTGAINQKMSLFVIPRREQSKLTLGQYQLPYHELLSLIELGIIHASELESGTISQHQALPLNYQNHHFKVLANSKISALTYYRFTPTGNELAHLLPVSKYESYQTDLIHLLSQYFIIESS